VWHRANAEQVNRERRERYQRRRLRIECLACDVQFEAPREKAERLVYEAALHRGHSA
jgi:hypothetical protein